MLLCCCCANLSLRPPFPPPHSHKNLLGLKDVLFQQDAIYFVMDLCCIDLYALSYVDHAAYSHLQALDFVGILQQVLRGLQVRGVDRDPRPHIHGL